MKNLINNIRGLLFLFFEKFRKNWPNPEEIMYEFLKKIQGKHNVNMFYDFTNKEITQSYLDGDHFYFDAGWCNAWPDTLSIMLENCVEPNYGYLRMNTKTLEYPLEGKYWDEKENKVITTRRIFGTPYIETKNLYKPPMQVFALIKVNNYTGGWLAPIWLYGYNIDDENSKDYAEIDLFETWYGTTKSKKRSVISLHYKNKEKRRIKRSTVKFLKKHENRMLLLRCDITNEKVKIYYDDKLVFVSKKHIPKKFMSVISSNFITVNDKNDSVLDIMASLPAHYDIFKLYIGASSVTRMEDEKRTKQH